MCAFFRGVAVSASNAPDTVVCGSEDTPAVLGEVSGTPYASWPPHVHGRLSWAERLAAKSWPSCYWKAWESESGLCRTAS